MTSEVMIPHQVTTTVNNSKASQDKLIESVFRISSEIVHHKWLHRQK